MMWTTKRNKNISVWIILPIREIARPEENCNIATVCLSLGKVNCEEFLESLKNLWSTIQLPENSGDISVVPLKPLFLLSLTSQPSNFTIDSIFHWYRVYLTSVSFPSIWLIKLWGVLCSPYQRTGQFKNTHSL